MKKKTERFQILMSAEMAGKLRERADALDMTMSEVIRQILKRELHITERAGAVVPVSPPTVSELKAAYKGRGRRPRVQLPEMPDLPDISEYEAYRESVAEAESGGS